MPRGLAIDLSAEKRDPRTHRHLGAPALQQVEDADHLLARGGEIRVEIGDEVAPGRERLEEPVADRLRLAQVALQAQEVRPPWHRPADALEQEGRAVGGSVIDQQQADSRQVRQCLDALGRQPMRLVEARNDD